MTDRNLSFEDVLTDLAAAYHQGLLVPFVGSGMSMPTCSDWRTLLRNLAEQFDLGTEAPAGSATPPDELYRLADRVVTHLGVLPAEKRWQSLRSAISARGADDRTALHPPTSQDQAVAAITWPLIVTTNYDDLLCAAHTGNPPVVMGRSLQDCHRVLRSLDSHDVPILWAVQGFVGGIAALPESVIADAGRRHELLNQVVLGHQQYQRAMNAEPHFRRAFAEVYRRRSLLFMGSGILESYLLNLFSEIIHHHGAPKYPHYALLCSDQRDRFDPAFMQTRLGIVPIFYEQHARVSEYLRELRTCIRTNLEDEATATKTRFFEPAALSYCIPSTHSLASLTFLIERSCLPTPAAGECLLVSVGRDDRGVRSGKQGRAQMALHLKEQWRALAPPTAAYAFRLGGTKVFAVAARRRDVGLGSSADRRDLGIIAEAVCTALSEIDHTHEYSTVHMGAVASGPAKPWHPIHPFAETLRGIRMFARAKPSAVRRIILHLVDPAIWFPVLAGKVPVARLLSAGTFSIRIEVWDRERRSDNFSVTLPASPTLKNVLATCALNRKLWRVHLSPPPMRAEATDEPDEDIVVSPTMTVVLRPREQESSMDCRGAIPGA